MTSEKSIFKKEYEPIDHYEESTWVGNDTPFMETEYTGVFRDRYPCVPGHTLFIPKKDTPEYVGKVQVVAKEFPIPYSSLDSRGISIRIIFITSSIVHASQWLSRQLHNFRLRWSKCD